jgi:hypothetical protein
MRFRVSMVGFSHNYSETFDKSSRECSWFMRRDMRVGGSAGQMFFTTDGRVVLRWAAALHPSLLIAPMRAGWLAWLLVHGCMAERRRRCRSAWLRAGRRTYTTGLRPAAYFEDYVELVEGGTVCVVRQHARHLGSGQVASQQLVGFK